MKFRILFMELKLSAFFHLFFCLQGIKPSFEPPPKPTTSEDGEANPFAIARPHATDLMLQRQTSFREFSRLQSRTSPFKRQLSLRMSELPSSLERKSNDAAELASSSSGSTNRKCSPSASKSLGTYVDDDDWRGRWRSRVSYKLANHIYVDHTLA